MNQRSLKRGVLVAACAVVALIAAGAFFMNAVLNDTANAEGTVHSEPTGGVDSGIVSSDGGFTVKTINGWGEPPAHAVTYQYAIAAVSEEAEHIFGSLLLTEEVFVELQPSQTYNTDSTSNDPRSWNVIANIEGGEVYGTVTLDGAVISLGKNNFQASLSSENEILESMQEHKREVEARGGIVTNNEGNGWSILYPHQTVGNSDYEELMESPEYREAIEAAEAAEAEGWYSEENQAKVRQEIADGQNAARNNMLATAEATKDEPQNAQAVDLVNSLGIAHGARAVSALTMSQYPDPPEYRQDGTPFPTHCSIEVALDNGKYAILDIRDKATMEFGGYYLRNTPLVSIYG